MKYNTNVLFFLLFTNTNLIAMEPSSTPQLTQPYLQGLPAELKIKIIEYAIVNYELSDSKKTFCALNLLNQNFHSLITDASTLKKLIQVMAYAITKEDTLSIINQLKSIPVVTTQEFQVWFKKEEKRILKEAEFLSAVQWCDNLDQIKKLIEHIDINARDSEGRTAVYLACKMQNLDVLNLLLEKKANINKPNKFHRTPLHRAVKDGNIQIVELLLKNGNDCNYADKYGYTPLISACANNDILIAQKILEANADINAQIGQVYHITYGPTGLTALMFAVRHGYVPMVILLLQYNPDLSLTFKEGDAQRETTIFNVIQKSPEGKIIKSLLLAHAKEKGLPIS